MKWEPAIKEVQSQKQINEREREREREMGSQDVGESLIIRKVVFNRGRDINTTSLTRRGGL